MASKYEQLKEKWHNWSDSYPGLDNLATGKFSLRLYEYNEKGGPATAVTLVFEDVFDAIGFIRFKQIPAILDFDTKTKSPDEKYKPAEDYLVKYEAAEKKKIKKIIDSFDAALKITKMDKDSLEDLRIDFNHLFARTKLVSQIHAWGKLKDYLDFECFEKVFKGKKTEEDDDDDGVKERKYKHSDDEDEDGDSSYLEDVDDIADEEEGHKDLKELLDSNKFDDHNEEHIILAINFLEQQEVV